VAATDPDLAPYGWILHNTGANAYAQSAVAGADIDARVGWQAGQGAGMTVAVIDTGIMTSHPDLQGALWTNPDERSGSADVDGNGKPGDVHGWNFLSNSADVASTGNDNAHGTNVAGVIGARYDNGTGSAGVAPNVAVMPLVIGTGKSVDLALGAQAIRYAADNGADVINASWGGTGAASLLQAAIDYANSKGVVVVAAAGNDAKDRDASPYYPASLDAPNFLTVGNSTAADTVSTSSAWGVRSVDLFAPGNLVYTTWNDGGYRLVSGTSIAAPHVAAAIALYKAAHPEASAAELRAELLADVEPVPAFAGRSVTGGRLSLASLGDSAEDVSYTFAKMTGEPGTLTPSVALNGSAEAGDYSLRLSLGMEHEGQILAVADQRISVGGAAATTDDEGTITVPLGQRASLGTVVVEPSLELTEGRYVLVAQLQRDGTALTAPHAAPLLVGEAAQNSPAPTSPAPTTPAPGADPTPPGTGTPTPAPSTGAPVPGTGTPAPGTGGPVPGTEAPDQQDDQDEGGEEQPGEQPGGGTQPTTPSDPEPGQPAPTRPVPAPGTGTPAPTPGAPAPGTGTPTPAPGIEQPGEDPAAPSQPGAGTPAPDLGGEKEYPEVGPFRLTSISPTRVSVEGGTRVTITGKAIPAGAKVRVGATATATVDSASATQLTFTAPARIAGVYDVFVFAPDGTVSVLEAGLTYVDASGGGQQPGATPSPTPGSDPGPDPDPGAGLPPDPDEGQEPDDTPEQVVKGPGGQRLVSSALFSSVPQSIWSRSCATACSGLPL
jgi:hypothetical protein